VTQPSAETAEFWAIPRLTEERRTAVRDTMAAFWSSRAVVWIAAIAAILIFGWADASSIRLDPYGATRPFHDDTFVNLLIAPGARFDSAWYLTIAHEGYDAGARSAFFPLFPALLSLGDRTVGTALLEGIAISVISGLGGLYLLHRLVTLDFDREHARTTVWLAAWFPGALVLSAVYSESLLLLFSVGSIYAARLGRWPVAGLLGGLAAASRSGGLVLLVPLLIIYLYGPRADLPGLPVRRGLRPQHRPRANLLWILLGVPAGILAYGAYLAATTGDPISALSAQAAWHRTFVPLGGIAAGLWSGIRSAADLVVPGVGRTPSASGHALPPTWMDIRELVLAGFLVGGLWLVYECARRLTPAYAAYAACGLALPLSAPAHGSALLSLPRFEFVLFPLWIALALWAHERHRVRQVLWLFGSLLAVASGLFAVWVMAP
jgi:hypothetical protein